MSFFSLDQPYLTVWMGTESGELAVYKVLRNPSNNTEIQMNSTGKGFLLTGKILNAQVTKTKKYYCSISCLKFKRNFAQAEVPCS